MDLGSPSQQGAVSSAASIDGALPGGAAALVEAPAVAVTDDTTLMLRYRDGDARAFELLYERHKGPLYRYLQRMCGRREVADDLFQEVWSKVIASRSRYEVRAQFNTFLFRIAHNCAVDYFRRSGRPHERSARRNTSDPMRRCPKRRSAAIFAARSPSCRRSSATCSCCTKRAV